MKEIIYNLIEQGELYVIIYKDYNIDKLKVLLNKYQNDLTFKDRIEYIDLGIRLRGYRLFGLKIDISKICSLGMSLPTLKIVNPHANIFNINDLPNE